MFSSFFSKLGGVIVELLDQSILVVEKTLNDIVSGCLGAQSFFDHTDVTVASLRSFIRSPMLRIRQEKDETIMVLYPRIIQSAERFLKSLAKLYDVCSGYGKNPDAKISSPDLSETVPIHDAVPSTSSKNLILDMELDIDSGSGDVDSYAVDGDQTSAVSTSSANQKMDLLLIMSQFFSILPSVTWEILFDLKEKERDPKVHRPQAFTCHLYL